MDDGNATTSRRAVLSAVGGGVLAAAGATSGQGGVVVEQGDLCRAVRPLGGDRTVAERYDYRAPFTEPSAGTFSSHGTVDLQRPDASVLFLYEGPHGTSLVMVHDALDDGTDGGSVSFVVSGLPPGREWVVEDDRYDGASNFDLWDHGRTRSRIDWTWGFGRTDGAAVRGLGDDFDVRVTPAFNEAATLFGQHYDGRVAAWEFLSAADGGVERVPLRMDAPVRVRTGACGEGGTPSTPTDPAETPTATPGRLEVPVEVVPDAVNPHRPGRLPVVVRSTDGFDATRVVPRTVRAGPAGARPVAAHPVHDGPGRPDLKLLFWLPALGLDEGAVDGGTGRLRLRAKTSSGRRVTGSDSFRVVPPRRKRDHEERREERREKREERREKREERREEREEERREEREKERREEHEERQEEREEERREEHEERREERKEERREEHEERQEERREKREERREEHEERREERREKREERREERREEHDEEDEHDDDEEDEHDDDEEDEHDDDEEDEHDDDEEDEHDDEGDDD